MNHKSPKHFRLMAIAPSTRGFGFAVLDGEETLVDWGVKSVKGDKNAGSLAKAEKLIAHYLPDAIVLEDHSDEQSRRAARIKRLSRDIIGVATTRKVKVKLFTRAQVRNLFFADGLGTKEALAEIIAKRFPEELGDRLPPKRRPWMSEDCRMDLFAAVALALVPGLRKAKRTARQNSK